MTEKYVISSGHSKFVRGASDIIDEVNEARKVVNRVHAILKSNYSGEGKTYHDNTSRTQAQNLNNIVDYHNEQERELDISVHFNAATNKNATGAECLYYDAKALSSKMSKAMADAMGIKDRGPKERKELQFLRLTDKKAILLEVCFVTSQSDTVKYNKNFEKLCQAIAKVIAVELSYKLKVVKKVEKIITVSDSAGNTSKYYKSNDQKGLYRIIKDCYQYSSVNFDKKNRMDPIKKGEAITVQSIVKYGSVYRLKTKYGYVTANKEFVQKV